MEGKRKGGGGVDRGVEGGGPGARSSPRCEEAAPRGCGLETSGCQDLRISGLRALVHRRGGHRRDARGRGVRGGGDGPRTGVPDVLSRVLDAHQVVDVVVEDPPLEEIIAEVFSLAANNQVDHATDTPQGDG